MAYDVHVVRTASWLDASRSPIAKSEVDNLVAADPDLAWSHTDYVDLENDTGGRSRYFAIAWRGSSCFFWLGSEICCANPDKDQLKKLIEMSGRLDAIVVGDDDERYTLGKSWFGRPKIITSE